MAFFVIKRAPKEPGTLKVVLGKNIAKKSATRNLLKRRVRAVIRPMVGKSEPGFVVIAKPGAADKTYKELRKELEEKTRT